MNKQMVDAVYLTSSTAGGSALVYGGLKITTNYIANSATGMDMLGYAVFVVGTTMLVPSVIEIYDRVKTRFNSKKSSKLEKILD